MPKIELTPRKFRRKPLTIGIAAAVLVAGGGALVWMFNHDAGRDADWLADEIAPIADDDPAVPPKTTLQLYRPLTKEEAIEENETLPFSSEPIEAAVPLVLPSSELAGMGRRSSVECLTSAIYYEAASETETGRRGVAQVILNRVRHPAFPNSICKVVYQGSERSTGCQFSFTCDGSLARRPSRNGWNAANRIAIAAISGVVEPSVGMATHYHADYVVPYWASSLDKITKQGVHIFYRWKGNWGRRRAFTQAARLDEDDAIVPTLDSLTEFELDEAPLLPEPAITIPIGPGLQEDETAGALVKQPKKAFSGRPGQQGVKADNAAGTLMVDEKAGSLKVE